MSKLCLVEGCEGKHYAKGWCYKHYARQWRHGSTDKKPPLRGRLHPNYKEFKTAKFPIKPLFNRDIEGK